MTNIILLMTSVLCAGKGTIKPLILVHLLGQLGKIRARREE